MEKHCKEFQKLFLFLDLGCFRTSSRGGLDLPQAKWQPHRLSLVLEVQGWKTGGWGEMGDSQDVQHGDGDRSLWCPHRRSCCGQDWLMTCETNTGIKGGPQGFRAEGALPGLKGKPPGQAGPGKVSERGRPWSRTETT